MPILLAIETYERDLYVTFFVIPVSVKREEYSLYCTYLIE